MPNATQKNFDPRAINQNDEDLQFISTPPSWFLRFGISAIAVVIAVFILGAALIKYPDVVTAKATLTTENPPIRLLAKSSGKISELLVKNNARVKAQTILCVIENAANYQHVLDLQKHLASNTPFNATQKLQLGSLQNLYSTYTQNIKDYDYYLQRNGVLTKVNYLEQQIANNKLLNTNLQNQKDIQAKEFELTEREYTRQKQLHTDGIVSDQDLEKTNAQLLQQKRQIESNEAAFINNNIAQTQSQSQINDLLQSKNDNLNAKQRAVAEDVLRLNSAIEEWKQMFLIVTPIAGTVSFSKIWSVQQSIASGDEVLAIVPSDSTKIFCKAVLPVAQSGKVKLGAVARISLDAFTFQQYGVLRGAVQNISLLPQKEDYQLDIVLNDKLLTSYRKQISFRQEMIGSANIITEDMTVIDRILNRFRDLLKNRLYRSCLNFK